MADAHRSEWGLVLAATMRVTRDFDLAEECVQDAYEKALTSWGERGVPTRPVAWLTTVARNRALDRLRHDATFTRLVPMLVTGDPVDHDGEAAAFPPGDGELSDDRLRLICTCCHPALSTEARVALTLRFVCGLSTAEVAHGFLVSESTMAARITRAKKKIAAAGIPFRVPEPRHLPERMDAVLTVVHLLLTTGHVAPTGTGLARSDVAEHALDLARILRVLLPGDPEVMGLTALILLTNARGAARTGGDGEMVLLADQDRAKWDMAAVDEGLRLARAALRTPPAGRFALQAAIAAVHAEASSWETTDWPDILGLYELLGAVWSSPVVALNRAVAIGFANGPRAGLAALDEVGADPRLAGYGYLAAARADFLRRLQRHGEARTAYDEALLRTENAAERRFLLERLDQLPD